MEISRIPEGKTHMIKILFVEGHPTTRDAIKVALNQFKGFEGEFIPARDCPDMMAHGQYHVVFVEDMPSPGDTYNLLDTMSNQEGRLPVVVIAEEGNIKAFIHEKKRLNISAFLRKPLDPVEVFRLLGRLRERVDALDLTLG